jgi:hypothetical protein
MKQIMNGLDASCAVEKAEFMRAKQRQAASGGEFGRISAECSPILCLPGPS